MREVFLLWLFNMGVGIVLTLLAIQLVRHCRPASASWWAVLACIGLVLFTSLAFHETGLTDAASASASSIIWDYSE